MIARLPLDSPLWHELDACFSTERAVESLREVLTRRQLGEPWDELRSELLHQGSVYGVTSAAIPHLVGLAPALTGEERAELWTEIGFWVTSGADVYSDAPADGLQEGLTEAIRVAEAGALAAFASRSGIGDSYFALACITLAGHPSGGAMWSFLSPGEGYVTLTCPSCEEQYEVDGFGDPLGPPCAPPSVPDLDADARDVPEWVEVADELDAAGDLLGSDWEGFVRAAAAVARAGVPETAPTPAVWCLVAAMVALSGDTSWARTIARLAGHFRCEDCESTWPIGDLIGDDFSEELIDEVDPAAVADENGFKPAPGGWPELGEPPAARVLWRVEGEPVGALTVATLAGGRSVLGAVGGPGGGLRRWDLGTGASLPAAESGRDALGRAVALTAVPLPDGAATFVAGGASVLRRWDAETGRPLGDTGLDAPVRALAPVRIPVPQRRHAADPDWLAALRDGRTVLVSGDTAGAVRLWDPATGAPHGELFRREGEPVTALGVVADEPSGEYVVTLSGEVTVDVWSSGAVTGERSSMTPPESKLSAIGHRALVAVGGLPGRRRPTLLVDEDGRVSLWETFGVRLGDPLPPDPAHTGIVALAALTALDGSLVVATASAPDANLRLWVPGTGAVTLIPLDATPRALHGVGTTLIVGVDTGVIALELTQP
jgi:hypothetical protein